VPIEPGRDAVGLAKELVRRPFDLAVAPLLRVWLLEVSATEHLLVVCLHHIVADGWSLDVLFDQLTELYNRTHAGQHVERQPLPLQYLDYAAWQRNRLQGSDLERRLEPWRARLADVPAVLPLPTDRPRPAVASDRGAVLRRVVPTGLVAELTRLAGVEDATLSMALLAGWASLLHRYSGQDDIVVGLPLAGRNRVELEGLIGLFVNTLPLRVSLSGRPSFRELVRRARDVVLEALAEQDLPFERLVEVLQPERSLAHAPVFQVLFDLQNVPRYGQGLTGLHVEPVELDTGTTKFDLTLSMERRPDELHAVFNYSLDLFSAATVTRMAAHLQILLEAAAAHPDQPVARLPLCTQAEQELAVAGNRATEPSAGSRPIHELVTEQALRRPQAIAARCGGAELTYAELDDRAMRLAWRLRDLGVGPEVLVGICVERSLAMVVGLLAILKAGGAYVPLDPAYPPDRLAFMLGDTRAPVLITHEHLLDRLPRGRVATVLLDGDAERVPAGPPRPLPQADPGNPAYVIYTSGSTGTPKGVQVSHGNLVGLFQGTRRWFGFNETDVWSVFHSYAFDVSAWELWGALLHGGRAVVVPYLTSRSPEVLLELLRREHVTILSQTPSAFSALLATEASAADETGPALRLVVLAGEALQPETLRPWLDRQEQTHPAVINMYGTTETTVHSTYRLLGLADLDPASGSPVGVPIAGVGVWVLDGELQPVPVGVAGQVYIGGAGVARGYLGRPGLTAERFVPDPFAVDGHPGRLYRTGDRARWRADGSLEFLGRLDHQLKVRGFRIEPAEVEAALTAHPAVRQAVVTARADPGGGDQLVAYLVGAERASVEGLRSWLERRLPAWMVPSVFVWLEALPLTPSGKLDRRALPAPPPARPELAEGFVGPRTPAERALAEIWCEVLGLERVGIHDDFFDLGGHSLLAVQVLARLRRVFCIDLPVQKLFSSRTIERLGSVVEEAVLNDILGTGNRPGANAAAPNRHGRG
jgi:amino acid adenylation domain-containing protein